jgi:hypothetical protein
MDISFSHILRHQQLLIPIFLSSENPSFNQAVTPSHEFNLTRQLLRHEIASIPRPNIPNNSSRSTRFVQYRILSSFATISHPFAKIPHITSSALTRIAMPFRFNSNRLMAIPTHHHPYRLRSTVPPGTRIAVVRSYSRSSIHQYPTKDAQDRNSLNPQSTQYSQSGGGDAAAANEKTAFDPRQTAPETQEKSAGWESGEVKGNKGVSAFVS